MCDSIASGFEFQPQPDGTVRIEFFDDDGKTINSQTVTRGAFVRIPFVAFVAATAMELGPDAAKKPIDILRAMEEQAEDGQ